MTGSTTTPPDLEDIDDDDLIDQLTILARGRAETPDDVDTAAAWWEHLAKHDPDACLRALARWRGWMDDYIAEHGHHGPANDAGAASAAAEPVAPPKPLPLEPPELENLRKRGLTDDWISRAQLRTVRDPKYVDSELDGSDCRFPHYKRLRVNKSSPKHAGRYGVTGLEIPFFDAATGERYASRFRFRYPRAQEEPDADGKWQLVRDANGDVKSVKYDTPSKGKLTSIDRHPVLVYIAPDASLIARLKDPAVPVVVCESELKGLIVAQCGYASIGLTGITNFSDSVERAKHKNTLKNPGKSTRVFIHPDLETHVEWKDRVVYILFDHFADKEERKRSEPREAEKLAHGLYQLGAREVRFCVPPDPEYPDIDDHYAHAASHGQPFDLELDCAKTLDLAAGQAAVDAVIASAEVVPRRAEVKAAKASAAAAKKSAKNDAWLSRAAMPDILPTLFRPPTLLVPSMLETDMRAAECFSACTRDLLYPGIRN